FSDLLDMDFGYHHGVQIKFLETQLQYYYAVDKLVLDSLRGIDIISLSPRDKFFKPLSWKVYVGTNREMMADKKDSQVLRLNTGGGFAYYHDWFGLWYAFIEPEFQYGTALDKNFSCGGGFSLGTVKNITTWWKSNIHARHIYFSFGDEHNSAAFTLSQHFIVTKNNSLCVDVSREKTFNEYNTKAKINWCRFF
ncbi:MAG: DUF4105 domain-containing protein, partial [bacterium]